MIVPDANLLLYAYDAASPFHEKARRWWENCLSRTEPVGLCPVVLFAFVRIGTHPRAYEPLQLPAASRAWLAERIVESLDLAQTDEIQRLWAAEAIRRRDEVRSGRVQPIPGDEVLAEVRRIVGR
jgi:putative addiction module component (TIGR02574 family)